MTVREYLATIMIPSASGGGIGTRVLDVWEGSPMRVDEVGLLDPILQALGQPTGDQSVAGKLDKVKSLAGAMLPAGFALTDPRYVPVPVASAPLPAPTASATTSSPSPTPPPGPEVVGSALAAPDDDFGFDDGLIMESSSAIGVLPSSSAGPAPIFGMSSAPMTLAPLPTSGIDPTWVIVGLTVLGLILATGRK